MKKIISMVLILVMSLGLVACSESGSDKPKGIVASEYVGEWIIMGGKYDAAGRTIGAFPVCLALADDGTATYQDATGTWEYVESENLIYVNGTEIGLPLKPVEVDGYVGLEYVPPMDDAKTFFNGAHYGMYTFFKEEPSRYASDSELVVGDWYTYQGETVSLLPDGTIRHNADIELSNWSLTCIGPYSIVDVGKEFPSLFYANDDSLVELEVYGVNALYSSKHSTLITVDNWRDYFSENITDSFEIISKEKKDEWGEPYTEFYITFKDVDKYTQGTHILIEVDNAANPISFGLEPERILHNDYEVSKIIRMKGLLVENP